VEEASMTDEHPTAEEDPAEVEPTDNSSGAPVDPERVEDVEGDFHPS
jgi:hypothetical protein